jgi:hypothetical protein
LYQFQKQSGKNIPESSFKPVSSNFYLHGVPQRLCAFFHFQSTAFEVDKGLFKKRQWQSPLSASAFGGWDFSKRPLGERLISESSSLAQSGRMEFAWLGLQGVFF